MAITRFADLVTYCKNLCKQNTDIAHTDSEAHFFRRELEDVLTSLDNNINFPAFILESFDGNFHDSNSDNLLKNRSTAFMVIDHCNDKTDHERVQEIWDDCEAIGDEFIARMVYDKASHANAIIRTFNANDVEMNTIANDARGYYGVRYSITFGASRTNTPAAEKWNDIE